MRRKQVWLFVLALACGCKPAATVKTYPVTGRVTIHQKPLEGATINFANKSQDSYSASAVTDVEGRFRLTTYVSPREFYAGAVPGEYTVIITKAPPGDTPSEEMAQMEHASPEERQAFMVKQMEKYMEQSNSGKPKPKSEVPEKYSSPETSKLKVTVVVGENPPLDWDLTE